MFRLGRILTRAGAQVWRVGFNAGDRVFWPARKSYLPFKDRLENWPDRLDAILQDKAITDIVLYGDTRPVHREAAKQAKARGLRLHVLEEGYLRPYWVTYERGGSNGHSPLVDMSIDRMRAILCEKGPQTPFSTATHWGDMRQHIFYGAVYHWFVMFANFAYRKVERHRELKVQHELILYLRRLFFMPIHALERMIETWRVRQGGFPYHLALLQLEHDESFRKHSPFATMSEFLGLIIAGFAKGAPEHHRLVIKAHPLETGRIPLRRMIRKLAKHHGIAGRVHYVRGGKLAPMLNETRSAITINSTAGQQVLLRGIPLKTFGRSVYDKPELVSKQPLETFFANPQGPDAEAYQLYRRFLLETSQIPGGYYSTRGRRQLIRQLADLILAAETPYERIANQGNSDVSLLKLVP
ncbi:MAG: capsular biosynthesis protein [Paracoccaceae bacterium]|jgi:capsular polysaccharide export protein|nr:capsular biosynthesis protein [Paracoccaceae bacterium]MDP7186548.1 capsular biosynthesis protein [Paracoccaceae bacterium]